MTRRSVLLGLMVLLSACGQDAAGPANDPVALVEVNPGSASVMVGATLQATVSLRDAAAKEIFGRPVRWRSGNESLASVSAEGLITGRAPGAVTITASSEGRTGSIQLTVVPVPVASVTVQPATAALGMGTSSQLSAVTRDSAGGVLTGRAVTWTSSAPGVVSVSSAGLITGVGAGSATITATCEGKSGSATITVDPTPVASVTISPPTGTVPVTGTLGLAATTRDANGLALPGRVVFWSSGDTATARVDPTGLVTGVRRGVVTITATSEGQSGSAVITVIPGPPAELRLSPSPASVASGETIQLSVVAFDAAGDSVPPPAVAWNSLTPDFAVVDAGGLVTGISTGTAVVTASGGGLVAADTVTVTPAPVAAVSVAPGSIHLGVGSSLTLVANLFDRRGLPLQGRPVAWTSSDSAVAVVSASGVVTGLAEGTVTLVATAEGKSGSSILVVENETVAAVVVSPANHQVGALLSIQLNAVTLAANGDTLKGRPITWSSLDPGVARVDSTGLVTGLVAGQATIQATAEGVTGAAGITVVVNLAFPALDGGFNHTCAITAESEAYCWGANQVGQLGSGAVSGSTPVPILVTGDLAFTALYPGGNFTCGLVADGSAYCWGDNSQGQLGRNVVASSSAPLPVTGGMRFVALTGGFAHACGLTTSGQAWCWGNNASGELGDGTFQSRSAPGPVSGSRVFVNLSSRGSHSCGVTAAGNAFCWGRNGDGELGDGSRNNRSTPVAVSGGHSFTQITTGARHTCALTQAGEAWCWGNNANGELGDGTTVDRLTPVPVLGGITFRSLKARGNHTCGVATDGTARCWGANPGGELGDGTTVSRAVPVMVQGGLTFQEVSSGFNFSCGVTLQPVLYCWGENGQGQLGNGTTVNSVLPVRVLGQP